MSSTELTFKLVEESDCTFYDVGDEIKLSGNALLLRLEDENTFILQAILRFPGSKKSCRTLIGDLTKLLIQHENIDKIPPGEIDCSGCSGSARLEHAREKTAPASASKEPLSDNLEIVTSLLGNFSIFRSLDEYNLRDIISLLKLKKFPRGAVVIKKGDEAKNLFIILSGVVDVLDDSGGRLSTLRKGEVFGEMSLISGDAVGATIKVAEDATIVYLEAKDFKAVLNKFSSVQSYLTRILAKRLADSNVLRAEEIASGMTGQLSELSVIELLQALNLSQKTGVLMLTLSKGLARLYLRDGNLVFADYHNLRGMRALYWALKEREGRFKFDANFPDEHRNTPPMGSMMEILLEMSRRIDEKSSG